MEVHRTNRHTGGNFDFLREPAGKVDLFQFFPDFSAKKRIKRCKTVWETAKFPIWRRGNREFSQFFHNIFHKNPLHHHKISLFLPRMISKIFFIGLISLGSVLADPVNFHLKVTCDPHGDAQDLGTWCGKLTIFEADSVTDHDVLRVSNFCTNGEATKFDYQLSPGGDYSTVSGFQNLKLSNLSSRARELQNEPHIAHGSSNLIFDLPASRSRRGFPKQYGAHFQALETHVNFHLDSYQIGEARECLNPNHGSIWNTIFG
ncbi:hypothetical protein CAEBREN_20141 [Caenorhabditis brenneri]|uniref:Uncharacterized protein n=1 Tax=Caenorhabditis brenneri TaxID=135651 RepID=G0N235_CAEBE|nr:hypothetical protein CAEBREN_20141 [Caenorhabditis brenneri]